MHVNAEKCPKSFMKMTSYSAHDHVQNGTDTISVEEIEIFVSKMKQNQ
jgi:hypothetical protein